MPGQADSREVAEQWAQKAENDIRCAEALLKLHRDSAIDNICFLAQQGVEKYLKALLSLKNIDFPKTHNISEILFLLPKVSRPKMTIKEQEQISNYAVVTRYPGDYGDVSFAEAKQALVIAKRVQAFARRKLAHWS